MNTIRSIVQYLEKLGVGRYLMSVVEGYVLLLDEKSVRSIRGVPQGSVRALTSKISRTMGGGNHVKLARSEGSARKPLSSAFGPTAPFQQDVR